jgi:hypothetical protein
MSVSTGPRRAASDAADHVREIGQSVASHPHARRAAEAARDASPWIERLGRLGYATKGVVYLLIGLLAVMAAVGIGGMTTDQQGAFGWVLRQPFGRLLLGAIAVGLFGYALWRLVQGLLDTDGKGTDAKGLQARGAYVVSALVYLGLSVTAAQLALGAGGSGEGQSGTESWVAWLFGQPFGRWIVAGIGAGLVGTALLQFFEAYTAKFRENLDLASMDADRERTVTRLGRLGFGARGVAFAIIGGFMLVAAIQARPEEARGLGGALDTLARQPFGPWLLGLVALGLAAYGLYMFAEARYRRMAV